MHLLITDRVRSQSCGVAATPWLSSLMVFGAVRQLAATIKSCPADVSPLGATSLVQWRKSNGMGSPDAFADVPMKLVREAVRNGVTYLPGPMQTPAPGAIILQREPTFELGEEQALREALTTVECRGLKRNRTCAFKNLYFNLDDNGFQVLSLEGTTFPDFKSVMLLHKFASPNKIRLKSFKSLFEFRDFVQTHSPKVHEGLSLVYDSIWHFNIGHALWDGLYPAFLALCEWGRSSEKFRSVVGIAGNCKQPGTEDGKCMSEGVFRRFGGGEFLPYSGLNGTGWHRFTDAVAGSGRKGQRSINRDYALPGASTEPLDGARLFRDRMYLSHGLEKLRVRTSEQALNGIIIDNKRFTPPEVDLLRTFANEVSSQGQIYLEYLSYGSHPYGGNFTKQLELVQGAVIHVSGPGTGQAYGPFLGDGSVHVNLGDRRSVFADFSSAADDKHVDKFVSFLEEVWSEGIPYIRALYYDPFLREPTNLQKPELFAIISNAKRLIDSSFAIPVPPGVNLSPVGQVFKEYCYANETGCEEVLSQMNGDRAVGFSSSIEDVGWCTTYAWAENIVFEKGGWSKEGQEVDGHVVSCALDRSLLQEIRSRHFGF